jgi:hypothetical protein
MAAASSVLAAVAAWRLSVREAVARSSIDLGEADPDESEESGGFCGRAVLFDCLVEEAADRGGGLGADEAGDGPAVAEDGYGGEALDPVLGGERLFAVNVDLDELELVLAFGNLGLDCGAEHAARPAPAGPEVDDDRQLVRALDHVLVEGSGGDVHRGVLLL